MVLTNTSSPDSSIDDTVDTLRYLFPSWPDELLRIYAEQWIETGDSTLALARTRAADSYEQYFPGIRREDGSLRMNEGEYLSALDLFNAEIESLGINSDLFRDTFTQLVEGDVSPREMLSRIESAFVTVVDRAPEIIQAYAEQSGLTDLSQEAIIASFLDPNVGEQILNRRISMAEISGQAAIRDFDLDLDLVERLYEVGISTADATSSFSAAADALPVLNVLARRHNDPDDDFDIEEFVGAQLLDDPFQRRRMRQLLAQERSLFTDVGSVARDRGGAVRGLVMR